MGYCFTSDCICYNLSELADNVVAHAVFVFLFENMIKLSIAGCLAVHKLRLAPSFLSLFVSIHKSLKLQD